jgi:hypothetical protein
MQFLIQPYTGIPVSRICNNSYGHFLQFKYIVTIKVIPPEDYTICHNCMNIRGINHPQ